MRSVIPAAVFLLFADLAGAVTVSAAPNDSAKEVPALNQEAPATMDIQKIMDRLLAVEEQNKALQAKVEEQKSSLKALQAKVMALEEVTQVMGMHNKSVVANEREQKMGRPGGPVSGPHVPFDKEISMKAVMGYGKRSSNNSSATSLINGLIDYDNSHGLGTKFTNTGSIYLDLTRCLWDDKWDTAHPFGVGSYLRIWSWNANENWADIYCSSK